MAQRTSVSLTIVADVHECQSPRQGVGESWEQHGGGSGASGAVPQLTTVLRLVVPSSLGVIVVVRVVTFEAFADVFRCVNGEAAAYSKPRSVFA